MAKHLDNSNGPFNDQGQDARVVDQKQTPTVGAGTWVFFILTSIFIIPLIVYLVKFYQDRNQINQLDQTINGVAGEIDNYLVKKQQVLATIAPLVEKAVKLDKDTMTNVAGLRSGNFKGISDANRNEVAGQLDNVAHAINVAVEDYPDLKAHAEIADAMQQVSVLQSNITAARSNYNDRVTQWNHLMFSWPMYQAIAAHNKDTTKIPFTATQEQRQAAESTDFFADKSAK